MDADVSTENGEESPVVDEIKMEQEIPVEEEVSDEEVNQRIRTEEANHDNFSSENFKIELQNLPKFFGIGQIKKLVNKKLNLNSNKIKPCGQNFMYLCFRNEEDKEKAMMVLNGFTFKGKQLKAVSAKAAADPYKKKKAQPQVVDTRPVEVRLQEVLCPHAKLSYEAQLERKLEEIVTTVKRLGAEISRVNPALKPLVQRRLAEHGTVAPIQEFLKSPCTRGYRNKVEFSIGYMNTETVIPATEPMEASLEPPNSENKDGDPTEAAPTPTNTPTIAVGFRLATYKEGSIEVVSLSSLPWPEDVLPHISPEMIKIGVMLEQFVAASGILPYNSVTNEGNWRNVMIRSAGDDQLMVVVAMDPKGLSSDQISRVRSDLVTFFVDGAGEPCKVTNLFLHLSPAKKPQGGAEPAPELLSGEPVITEKLFDLIFSISPQAFFQVNTRGAEVLYSAVGDLADLQQHSTLVDVCCGTGTIGLCLANRVRKVIGVELVPEAVRDARKNAERNGVENCSFLAGRAENILVDVLRDIDSKDVVAVVDPPRAGLHNKALSAIRNTLAIKRLVYVSCDAKAAMKNFVDLSRAPSKTCRGDPFFPVKIVPVDLFPHTKQFELVLLFQRVSSDEINQTGDQTQPGAAAEPEKSNGAS